MDFVVDTSQGDGLIKTVSAMSPSGVTGGVNAAFRAFYDIEAPWKATVIDDRVRPWKDEDIALLRGVGEVFRWGEEQVSFEQEIATLRKSPVPPA